MTHEQLVQALRTLAPNASWSAHSGHNPETGKESHVICWSDPAEPQPSDAAILAEVTRAGTTNG